MKNPASDPAVRRSGLGSSDAAAARGASRWKTRLNLVLEKRGEIPPPDLTDNERVQFGILLEDVIAREWARRKGVKVRCVNRTVRHPAHKILMAHPDREVVGEPALLEVKTTDKYMRDEWGAGGDGKIPPEVYHQAQHQLMVTGKDRCYLAVLIGGNELRDYSVERDEDFIKLHLQECVDFWRRYVEGDELPPTSNSDDVLTLYPVDTDSAARATIEVQHAYDELVAVRDHIDGFRCRQAELEHQIKGHMKDAGELIGFTGLLATWKTQKTRRLDAADLRASYPEMADQFTKESETRVFRLKRGGDNERA